MSGLKEGVSVTAADGVTAGGAVLLGVGEGTTTEATGPPSVDKAAVLVGDAGPVGAASPDPVVITALPVQAIRKGMSTNDRNIVRVLM